MLSVIIRAVGNPDHGQFADVAPPAIAKAKTERALVKRVQAYIACYDLGAGNFSPSAVSFRGQDYGTISYNGRITRF